MDDGSHRKLMANIYQIGKLHITAIAMSRPAATGRRPARTRLPAGPGARVNRTLTTLRGASGGSGRRGAVSYRAAGGELASDEGIKAGITLEELAAKKPAFRKGGTVTGGNSSPLNDGAAALLLMSDAAVNRAGLTPLARYVGASAAGVHPDYMGIGPVPAMNRALTRARWRTEELDLAELNEAFAAQSVACVDELKLDPEKVNVNGGAIAIGHPLGCSGARIISTLLHEMRRRGSVRGAASMCIGVGQGIASLWEAC